MSAPQTSLPMSSGQFMGSHPNDFPGETEGQSTSTQGLLDSQEVQSAFKYIVGSVPWVSFQVEGEADFSVFQTDPQLRSTLTSLTEKATTTVVKEVTKEFNSEANRVVTGVAQSAIHRISSQLVNVMQELLLSNTSLYHISTPAESLVTEHALQADPSSQSSDVPSDVQLAPVISKLQLLSTAPGNSQPQDRAEGVPVQTLSPNSRKLVTPDLSYAKWIWTREAASTTVIPGSPPAGARPFRKTLSFPLPVDRLTIDICCDNFYTLYVNGALVGSGINWALPQRYNVIFKSSRSVVIAVYAVQDPITLGAAGLLAAGVVWSSGPSRSFFNHFATDVSWKTLSTPSFHRSFISPHFRDDDWENAIVQKSFGEWPWIPIIHPTTSTLQNPGLKNLFGGIPDAPIAPPADVTTEPNNIKINNKDPAIYYHGRWDADNRAWWNGTGFKLHFKNLSQLSLNLGNLTNPNAPIGVSINYKDFETILTTPGNIKIPLGADVLEDAVVRINIQLHSSFNKIQLDSLEINEDAKMLHYTPSKLMFQFIGDSLSSGYNGADLVKWINQAWPFLLSEHFKAEHNITSQPGAFLSDKPHFDQPHGLSVEFFHTEDAGYFWTQGHQFTTPWDFSRDVPAPTHLFIHLGANDYYAGRVTDDEFFRTYMSFLDHLRTIYRDQPIFVVAPWGFTVPGALFYVGVYQRIVDARHAMGDKNVYHVDATNWTTAIDYTPDGHQNAYGHRTVANKFTEYLQQWGLKPEAEWPTPAL